jgi:hypothetical protein
VEFQVKGIGGGECYELIDTVVGSSILPWRPIIEYTSTENLNEAFRPALERLPASAAHEGNSLLSRRFSIHRQGLLPFE